MTAKTPICRHPTKMSHPQAKCRLKSGQFIEIEILEPPIQNCAPSTHEQFNRSSNEYPVHFGWEEEGRKILRGDYVAHSRDRFFVGKIDGEVAGSILLNTPRDEPDVGLTLQVLTKARHRNKGVVSHLLKTMVDVFVEEGGVMLYLPTNGPIAARAYRKVGFANHIGCGMRYLAPGQEAFDASYFTYHGKGRLREAKWGDFARFVALYNSPTITDMVRHYVPFLDLRCIRGFTFHRHFRRLIAASEQGKARVLVLCNAKKRMVAAASLHEPPSFHEQHVGVLNFVVVPAYAYELPELLHAIIEHAGESGSEILHTYVADADEAKRELLASLGFEEEGRFRGCLKLPEGNGFDLLLYARHLPEQEVFPRSQSTYYGGIPDYVTNERKNRP